LVLKALPSKVFNRVADNLYRTGEGTYYARLRLKGKNFKSSLGTHDRKTADRKLSDYIKEIENKEAELPDVYFPEFADKWLETIKPRLKASSYTRRVSSIKQFKPLFMDTKMREITLDRLQKWEASRSKISNRTFNVDRETIHLIFKYAVKLNLISKNPIDKESLPKRKEPKAIITPPTREQFTEMLAVLRENSFSQEAVPYVEFLAYTGLRLEEINSVKWQDVDFTKGLLTVTGGETGTKNQQRSIPLFPPARAVLEHLSNGKKMPPIATIFKQKSARSSMKTACVAMGMEEDQCFTHHDLRHFFCSNALEKNVPDHVIAAWLGHKDGGILVRKTYGHLRQSHSTEMAKLMAYKA
jgi:integrase